MNEPLKLRGVVAMRHRLADGSTRFYYRHRKSGTMLGSSADIKAVLRNYKRLKRAAEAPVQLAPMPVRPRLVPVDIAAQYCSLSVADFEHWFGPQLHKHEIAGAVRYDLREVDWILDGGGIGLRQGAPARRASDDDDLQPLTLKEAAAWCKMSLSTFDQTIRKHPLTKELHLRLPGKKKGLIQFSLGNLRQVYAQMFGQQPR